MIFPFLTVKNLLQGHTPQAAKVAQLLKSELDKLQTAVQKASVRSVIEHFMDATGPLSALEKAANAPPGNSNNFYGGNILQFFLVSYVGERPWWPIKSPDRGSKEKVKA